MGRVLERGERVGDRSCIVVVLVRRGGGVLERFASVVLMVRFYDIFFFGGV